MNDGVVGWLVRVGVLTIVVAGKVWMSKIVKPWTSLTFLSFVRLSHPSPTT